MGRLPTAKIPARVSRRSARASTLPVGLAVLTPEKRRLVTRQARRSRHVLSEGLDYLREACDAATADGAKTISQERRGVSRWNAYMNETTDELVSINFCESSVLAKVFAINAQSKKEVMQDIYKLKKEADALTLSTRRRNAPVKVLH